MCRPFALCAHHKAGDDLKDKHLLVNEYMRGKSQTMVCRLFYIVWVCVRTLTLGKTAVTPISHVHLTF